ncbi:MAG: hypothetical protein H0X29_11380 [Parachlamydiaceae bacterium]|nr:hypothetical protein [Parachlamydiaceae bacterium]
MIEIKEIQKRVEDNQIASYLVKQIDINDIDSLLIYTINQSSLEKVHKMLAFYLRSQSVDGKTSGGFVLQRNLASDAIIITGNLQNAVIGLRTLKFISEPTIKQAMDSIICKQVVKAMQFFPPSSREDFKSQLFSSLRETVESLMQINNKSNALPEAPTHASPEVPTKA